MEMVSKQGWFLITQPQAFVSRIFKPRYSIITFLLYVNSGIILVLCGGVFGKLEKSLLLVAGGALGMEVESKLLMSHGLEGNVRVV